MNIKISPSCQQVQLIIISTTALVSLLHRHSCVLSVLTIRSHGPLPNLSDSSEHYVHCLKTHLVSMWGSYFCHPASLVFLYNEWQLAAEQDNKKDVPCFFPPHTLTCYHREPDCKCRAQDMEKRSPHFPCHRDKYNCCCAEEACPQMLTF